MRKMRLGLSFVVAAVSVLLLVACGDEVTEITEVNETGMKVIEKGEDMPKCTSENEGALVYALDSATAYSCVNREWTSLNGKDGQDGKDGAKGEKGDQGEQGKQGEKGDQGKQGEQGPKGDDGKDGEDGTGCSVEDTGDGFALVTCGEGENASIMKIFKGMCGETPYNPATHFCDFRDSTIYRFVTIGTQTWMAENLNYAYTDVPYKSGDYTSDSTSWCYEDDANNCSKYGRLYTWAAAMDSVGTWSTNGKGCGYNKTCSPTYPVRGVCPKGWHLPTKAEFETLFTAVGGQSTAGKMLKSATGWTAYSGITNEDAFAFSALPAGYRYNVRGYYDAEGYFVRFWSSTDDIYSAYFVSLSYSEDDAYLYGSYKYDGYFVRCLKD
ncbi:MAG: hypothetical protein K6E57_04400 [Fibrobacter sp.]|nr:hypothetical protein [Fibrobacter sp.]